MLDSSPPWRDRRFVEGFDDPRPDPARQGGKGASLARLTARGHRIPPGFVITVDAFRATIASLALDGDLARVSEGLARGEDVSAPGSTLERGLLGGRTPQEVLGPILAAARAADLFPPGGGSAIVRSSATVEDSASHSFAGIFESIPVAGVDDLEPAIRAVWASAFSPRALAYADQPGLRRAPDMAVVVQRFVDAWRSGVMFTRFAGPGGEERILVEHVEGGCEKLVRGEVIPERLWLPLPAVATPGGSAFVGAVPADSQSAGDQLPEGHVRELVRLAGELEDLFGGPQDVEWVIADDVVHVVQSRPITVGGAGAPAASRDEHPRQKPAPVVSGLGASPGRGSGPVRLVFNIEQALGLRTGQVLVTPMTNPDMVVAMRNAAAVVTDVGGMICHAAIVSRELGLPCVVGTETATATLGDEALVTVDGNLGHVYEGDVEDGEGPGGRPVEWTDLWALWDVAMDRAGHPGVVPLVSTVEALEGAPLGLSEVVLVPDVDLRCDGDGLWRDLDGLPRAEATEVLRTYVRRVRDAAQARAVGSIRVAPDDDRLVIGLADAVRAEGAEHLQVGPLETTSGGVQPLARVAALGVPNPNPDVAGPSSVDGSGIDGPLATALDTLSFFGHVPRVRTSAMPDPAVRAGWWAALPEYGRYHAEHGTAGQAGEYEWLEVRPELVISALLKSLVQPGFEMVPRVMGFRRPPPDARHVDPVPLPLPGRRLRPGVAGHRPRHVGRGIHGRPHAPGPGLVREPCRGPGAVPADGGRASDARRRSDGRPDHVVVASVGRVLRALLVHPGPGRRRGLPVRRGTVRREPGPTRTAPLRDFAWPASDEFVAPTTPVMSGEYMADVGALRDELLAAQLTDADGALAALQRGAHPQISDATRSTFERWRWMRDRDLLFEPWDTPRRVVETALATEPHAPVPYAANLRRQLVALGFHSDLAPAGRPGRALNHHTRFLHDLNVERENHHVLWLKDSYPLRRLVLEIERRLVEAESLPARRRVLPAGPRAPGGRRSPARTPPRRGRRAGPEPAGRVRAGGEAGGTRGP